MGVCMLSHVGLFATPWTVALQTRLSMWFSRQEYWSGLPFPTPGDLPDAGIEPASLVSPALAGRFFTNCAIWQNAPGKMQYSIFFADLASRYLFCLNSCSSHKWLFSLIGGRSSNAKLPAVPTVGSVPQDQVSNMRYSRY